MQSPRAEAAAVVDLGATAPGVLLSGELILRSTGSGPVVVESVEIDNEALGLSESFPIRIPAQESRSLTVDFVPTSPGPASATLTVRTNDPANPELTVRVDATVRDTSEPIVFLSTDPITISFDDVYLGEVSLAALPIVNLGEPDLEISVAIEGEGFGVVPDQAALIPARIEQNAISIPGFSQQDLQLSFNPSGLGDRTGTLTFTTNDPTQPRIEVPLSGRGIEAVDRPSIGAGGIVDAASFGSTVSQGGIASLFGVELADDIDVANDTPLPLNLRETRVFVDGWEAPLFFVSPTQINFQMPFEVRPNRPASVVVRRNGADSAVETVQVADYAPAVFANPATGEPIAIRPDGSLITTAKPARPGDVLILL